MFYLIFLKFCSVSLNCFWIYNWTQSFYQWLFWHVMKWKALVCSCVWPRCSPQVLRLGVAALHLLLESVHGLSSFLLRAEALTADLLCTQTGLPAAHLTHTHTPDVWRWALLATSLWSITCCVSKYLSWWKGLFLMSFNTLNWAYALRYDITSCSTSRGSLLRGIIPVKDRVCLRETHGFPARGGGGFLLDQRGQLCKRGLWVMNTMMISAARVCLRGESVTWWRWWGRCAELLHTGTLLTDTSTGTGTGTCTHQTPTASRQTKQQNIYCIWNTTIIIAPLLFLSWTESCCWLVFSWCPSFSMGS